ncbi:tRNA (adenosine(37)-N6)-threonylcarbamoyltransferase complex ATPase subunit type 1 TsaE [Legionella israelensis]|uniref:tRNA threonylcarbamoyladenosine biosynthesis protein TsaE n=1 Tax=Legionella israelensis TaxID=454 RepID=A0A0W0V2U0_9GAMM|nr:tRNA (adenosine(37)-N6)-threonylcarbamoyltransferase complex ATPase subunit type 1 TsaE [Legionella israelensis]KTD14456.1 ATPase or kinase [Legionella israelensis]QBS09331.1 tRNA (adenosine(37)-N6)-threonylcarbamoyltransferase complex ATPase subunit type 1 TsaE [Legionella israelensis]SCX90002.1 tRNA threonylcarbamoyladenosine biosynthesis protein TsaE [Legionella israelensis DSM 19235]STX60229.1 ATPase or kinase [Legionella israelensis]
MTRSALRTVWKQTLSNEDSSRTFGKKLANCLLPSAVLAFSGELGAGKTTIIRAMLRALGVASAIKSPTFSLVESYQCQSLQIHHFDLYRIQDEEELEYIGFREYFSEDAICCIEWPEKASNLFIHTDLQFDLKIKETGREMRIKALSVLGERILTCLTGGV